MLIVNIIVGISLACLGGWIYGEFFDNRVIRVASSIGTVIVCSSIAAMVSSFHVALSVGVPFSTAVHEYLDASAAQLTAGHADFVLDGFKGFKERAHVTYERGQFLDAMHRETARMKAGPKQEEVANRSEP